MAGSMPSLKDILTRPSSKIVFNAPFDEKHIYYIEVFFLNSIKVRVGVGSICSFHG